MIVNEEQRIALVRVKRNALISVMERYLCDETSLSIGHQSLKVGEFEVPATVLSFSDDIQFEKVVRFDYSTVDTLKKASDEHVRVELTKSSAYMFISPTKAIKL